jgi:predicted O-linked N-acetylglucosamine transferase (SPINDLY family)
MTPTNTPAPTDVFREAVALHKAGRMEEAQRLYREVLARTPDHADALHLLGVVHHQQGDQGEALRLIGRAIALKPGLAAYWNNYGAALLEVGSTNGAGHVLNAARAAVPVAGDDRPDVLPAGSSPRRASGELGSLGPDHVAELTAGATAKADGHSFNGRSDPGRAIEAMACFQHAIALKPDYADAMANLGMAQDRLGQDALAVESLRGALKADPTHADALGRLSGLLQRMGKGREAIELLSQTVRANPKPPTLVQLGNLQLSRGAAAEAAAAYEKALKLEPDSPAASFNLGSALQEQLRADEAVAAFRRAAELPRARPLWQLRPASVCPTVFENTAAIDAFCHRTGCTLDAWMKSPPTATPHDLLSTAAFPNFSYAYLGRNVRPLKEKFARLYEHYFRDPPPAAGSGQGDRRRIGLVVTERHEGIFLRCTKHIWQGLDRERFELVLLASEASVKPLRQGLGLPHLQCVALPPSLPDAIRRIRQTACDLIYYWEVGSDAMNYFLPFARLAPVQCTSHGSQITSGVPAVDWFVSSKWLEGDDSQAQYTERLWQTDSLLMCQPRISVVPGQRSQYGLPDERTLYVSLQNPLKLHPDFDSLLAGILDRDPHGLVVLLSGRYEFIAAQLRARFARTMGKASERVMFLPWQPFDDYCRLMQLADVVLDPPHFGHGSSAYDVFSFNKPLVTLPGYSIVSRVGAACYRRMGLADLIAADAEQYIALALRLGADRDDRRAVEQRIAAASGVLFDDATAIAEHERFFAAITRPAPD